MQSTKFSTKNSAWKPDILPDELEELIDPTDKAEIQQNIETIMQVLSSGKKLRKEAYKFTPSKLKKEKLLKKGKKRLDFLRSKSFALSKENEHLKSQLKKHDQKQTEKQSDSLRKKFFKRPDPEEKDLLHHEDFSDVRSLVKSLQSFNLLAASEVASLGREIDSDKYNYDINN